MKQKFTIHCKPFSVNSMYYSQRNIKTADCREWTAQILFALNAEAPTKAMEALRSYFDPKKHVYRVAFTFRYPKHLYFTKNGDISSRTMDCTNVEKPLLDILFSTQYFNKPCPDGAANLNTNDRYVASCYSCKLPAEVHSIDIELEIIELEDLFRIESL